MTDANLSLDLTILELIKNIDTQPSLGIPFNLFQAAQIISPCTEQDFDTVLKNLYREGLIHATDSWNAGILRVHYVTAAGLALLRNPIREAANYNNVTVHGNVAGQVAVINDNSGTINIEATQRTYAEIDQLFKQIETLPLKEEDQSILETIRDDFESAKTSSFASFKKRLETVYLGIISSLAASYGSSELFALGVQLQSLGA